MTDRTNRLRRQSLDTPPSLSAERAVLLTEFYEKESGRHSAPVLRALSFLHLCQHKTLYLGDGELIVGERGPSPKVVPTYPELNCHSAEDLRILNSRPKTWCGQAGEWQARCRIYPRDVADVAPPQLASPGGVVRLSDILTI